MTDFPGSWGTRANISFESANVTYSVYRDEVAIETGLGAAAFSDDTCINDIEYTYAVSATYPDGEESDLSSHRSSISFFGGSFHQKN